MKPKHSPVWLNRLRQLASRSLIACAAVLLPLTASAGYVTTNEAGMDLIFSQGSFSTNAIDIRFNPVQWLDNSALTNLDSASEFSQLGALNPASSLTIMAFFVDKINWCGSPGSSIIGCGYKPGNIFAIDSSWAARSAYGAALLSHELGHNLNLDHSSTNGNLMYAYLTGGAALTVSQANTILSSNLVQWDSVSHHRYISITPVAVVPEPEIFVLFTAGLMLLGFAARQRRTPR